MIFQVTENWKGIKEFYLIRNNNGKSKTDNNAKDKSTGAD